MGSHTELAFVEGHSTDNTLAECRARGSQRMQAGYYGPGPGGPGQWRCRTPGLCAGHRGHSHDLDADLSVAPEDLHNSMMRFCG